MKSVPLQKGWNSFASNSLQITTKREVVHISQSIIGVDSCALSSEPHLSNTTATL
jgi:hypothetical protein